MTPLEVVFWALGACLIYQLLPTVIGILLVAVGWLGQVMFHIGMRYLDAEDE